MGDVMGRSHYAVGWAAWVAGNAAAGPPHPVPLIGGGLIAGAGALLPDMDHPSSKAARSLGLVTELVAMGVRKIAGGHRAGTHSLAGTLIVAVAAVAMTVVLSWPWWPCAALVSGYLAHIAADMLTVSGCPLAYPSRRPFWLSPGWLRFATGHGGEPVAVAVIIAGAVAACWAGWVA